jgi:hypothetical protein
MRLQEQTINSMRRFEPCDKREHDSPTYVGGRLRKGSSAQGLLKNKEIAVRIKQHGADLRFFLGVAT